MFCWVQIMVDDVAAVGGGEAGGQTQSPGDGEQLAAECVLVTRWSVIFEAGHDTGSGRGRYRRHGRRGGWGG